MEVSKIYGSSDRRSRLTGSWPGWPQAWEWNWCAKCACRRSSLWRGRTQSCDTYRQLEQYCGHSVARAVVTTTVQWSPRNGVARSSSSRSGVVRSSSWCSGSSISRVGVRVVCVKNLVSTLCSEVAIVSTSSCPSSDILWASGGPPVHRSDRVLVQGEDISGVLQTASAQQLTV